MVKLCGVPAQPFADGVTVIVPAMGDEVLLVPVNDAILPVPADARPMPTLLFVHA
jgi:hypothetical protein